MGRLVVVVSYVFLIHYLISNQKPNKLWFVDCASIDNNDEDGGNSLQDNNQFVVAEEEQDNNNKSNDIIMTSSAGDDVTSDFDEVYGAQKYNTDDFDLDAVDQELTEEQKFVKMEVCFLMTQQNFERNQEQFVESAKQAADAKGMRQDDILRFIFYARLVSCYHNILQEDIDNFSGKTLVPAQRAEQILGSLDGPRVFSAKQNQILEDVASRIQNRKLNVDGGKNHYSGQHSSIGMAGIMFGTGILTAIGGLLFIGVRKLASMREKQPKASKKLSKSEKKKK